MKKAPFEFKKMPRHLLKHKPMRYLVKVCPECNVEFITTRDYQIYCSEKCCKAKEKRAYWANRETMAFAKNHWLKIRWIVLKRDNFTCQYCGRKAPDVILEVDHVIPKSKNGGNELTNLKTSCYECNHGKYDDRDGPKNN